MDRQLTRLKQLQIESDGSHAAVRRRSVSRTNRRSIVVLSSFVIVALAGCHQQSAQQTDITRLTLRRDASRFAIGSTSDSTVTFRSFEAAWLKPGLHGQVVDPLQRDALIARVTIRRSDSTGMIAVIDGGVAPVTTAHIVLFAKPVTAWWHDKRFWFGAGAGVVTGVLLGTTSR